MKTFARLVMPLLVISATCANGAIKLSDDQIRTGMVGSWIVPSDSTDYGPENQYGIETYTADGYDNYVVYGDNACKRIRQRARVRWMVQNGVLLTLLPDGGKLSDEVVSLDGDKLTLRSLDDGTTYTRIKGTICAGPPTS